MLRLTARSYTCHEHSHEYIATRRARESHPYFFFLRGHMKRPRQAIMRTIAPSGFLYSFEFNEIRATRAQEEFEENALGE